MYSSVGVLAYVGAGFVITGGETAETGAEGGAMGVCVTVLTGVVSEHWKAAQPVAALRLLMHRSDYVHSWVIE